MKMKSLLAVKMDLFLGPKTIPKMRLAIANSHTYDHIAFPINKYRGMRSNPKKGINSRLLWHFFKQAGNEF